MLWRVLVEFEIDLAVVGEYKGRLDLAVFSLTGLEALFAFGKTGGEAKPVFLQSIDSTLVVSEELHPSFHHSATRFF